MIWITLVLAVSKLLYVSALECFHMNKYGVSKLVTCRGYCASISAVVANNNLAEVNYCVPERRCLAELDSRQLTDMGSLICRGLIDSANPGAITRCRAAVCQSDGCNNYNFRSDPEMNDCSIHQCSNAACHNPEELLTTIEPPVSSSLATATTPFITDDQKIITAEPELTTPGSSDGEMATEKVIREFETTGATTAGNEITTKEPAVTTGAEVETEKPSTEIAPSSSNSITPSEKPATEPKEQTTAKVETLATTTMTTEGPIIIETEEPEIVTEKESPTTPEKTPTTAKPEPTVMDEEEDATEEQPTLGDFDTQTRGPPLVPTDFKETETATSFPPTVAEVTTDGVATSEAVFDSTEFSEVTLDVTTETGVTTEDQRTTTDVVDITRTPNRSTKFQNYIGSSEPPNQDMNEDYLSNNSFDVEVDMEITNRDTIVRADANSSAISASYLSLSLIFLVSAVIL